MFAKTHQVSGNGTGISAVLGRLRADLLLVLVLIIPTIGGVGVFA